MPIYSYHCEKCNSTESKLCSIAERVNIPVCDKGKKCEMKQEIFTTTIKVKGKGTNLNTLEQSNQRLNNEKRKS